ncbi:MAG: hypothetical protein IPQ18_13810 [Saprospiraceae bacterium]|nr:hypothetical protein [Saprospiraceae bacterium]
MIDYFSTLRLAPLSRMSISPTSNKSTISSLALLRKISIQQDVFDIAKSYDDILMIWSMPMWFE